MSTPKQIDALRLRQIIESCLRRELGPKKSLPRLDEDLIESGALDSMAWVGVIRCVEAAAKVPDLGARLADSPASIQSLLAALQSPAPGRPKQTQKTAGKTAAAGEQARSDLQALLLGWAEALGSQVIPVAQIESEHGLPPGKLQNRAGIESVRRVAGPENEINLAVGAARAALKQARARATDLDFLVVTSETSLGYPSLGAQLHSRLLARDTCGVLDVGGACLGLINGFAVARALVATGSAPRILVVSADVHSHHLAPGRVPGEFGGLFGDGASAFVVAAAEGASPASYRLGEFIFGCAGAYAGAIRVGPAGGGRVDLHFDGEALSRAALSRLERTIADLELRTGLHRDDAAAFATHQPNPRLIQLLARQMHVPIEKFPIVARLCGNLGASTCGAALNQALTVQAALPAASRLPIFLASLGPGLLWGGGVLHPAGREGVGK
jgi:3-oxoacyl-[acyl-carrier-protein] synthase-3